MVVNEDIKSILLELENENEELKKALESYKPKLSDEVGFGYNFVILSKSPLKISGVLLSEGVWKGIKYLYDEMKKALPKFKGLKGMVLHGKSEEYKDRVIGKLTKVTPNDMLKSLVFEAIVDDPQAIEDIKNGVFDAVSLKIEAGQLDTSTVPPEGRDYTPYEWSLTSTPACETCLIFSVDELSLNAKEECDEMGIKDKKIEENTTVVSLSEEKKIEAPKVETKQVEPIKETPPPSADAQPKPVEEKPVATVQTNIEQIKVGKEEEKVHTVTPTDIRIIIEAPDYRAEEKKTEDVKAQPPPPQPEVKNEQPQVQEKPAVEEKPLTIGRIKKYAKEKNIDLATISAELLIKSLEKQQHNMQEEE